MKFIFVAQHCYAIITPETPGDVAGVFTEGLETCSGVILKASAKGCYFFCHADVDTLLNDPRDGIPAWINLIRGRYATEPTDVILQYDRPPGERDLFDETMDDIIKTQRVLPQNSNLRFIVTREVNRTTGVILYREDGRIVFNSQPRYDIEGPNAPDVCLNTVEESDFVYRRGDLDAALEEHGIKKYPPVCVYDSRTTLTIDDIKGRYSSDSYMRRALDGMLPPIPRP